jgi:hypothetical protein
MFYHLQLRIIYDRDTNHLIPFLLSLACFLKSIELVPQYNQEVLIMVNIRHVTFQMKSKNIFPQFVERLMK